MEGNRIIKGKETGKEHKVLEELRSWGGIHAGAGDSSGGGHRDRGHTLLCFSPGTCAALESYVPAPLQGFEAQREVQLLEGALLGWN